MEESSSFHQLYDRSRSAQWTPETIDWSLPSDMTGPARKAWLQILDFFYSLEAVGLHVVSSMIRPVTQRVKDPSVKLYMSMQVSDEARHTFVMERYFERLGERSRLQAYGHFFASFTNPLIYKVDSWFFSTLFAENTASIFTKMIGESPVIDPLAKEIFHRIFKDEGRHLRFLHLALPGVVESLTPSARFYIKWSQRTLLEFGSLATKLLERPGKELGLWTPREFNERVVDAMETQYKKLGIDAIIPFADVVPRGYGR